MASTRTQSVEPLSSETAKPERIRLDFLDGMRGLAALYVLFCHVYVALKWWSHGAEASPRLMKVLQVFDYGHCAVVVFIVMSGYCLMLPIAQATDGQLRGGFGAYIKRRARRILPPYFAALAISLLLIFVLDRAGLMGGELQANVKSAFTPGSLVSHLLVVHNLNPTWSHTIDPPMWSVATEWQIYFLFPALLLPLWQIGRAQV